MSRVMNKSISVIVAGTHIRQEIVNARDSEILRAAFKERIEIETVQTALKSRETRVVSHIRVLQTKYHALNQVKRGIGR